MREWAHEHSITSALQEELQGDLERLSSNTLAALFEHHCPVAGAHPDDYKNRLLHVGGLELLTGIRFRGLDMAQPFVDVLYQSEVLLTPEQLVAIRDALRRAYAVFTPKRLRVYQSSQYPPLPGDGDTRLVAAPLRVIAQEAPASPRLVLRPSRTLEFYPKYAEIYARLHAERPELIPVARAESKEDLESYLEAGNLFDMLVDGAWAGTCAVFADVASGVRGFCFGEIVLDPAYRGQSLGSVAQGNLARLLIERGDAADTFLFGTIGAVNHGALRAASKAGRLDLGGLVWLDL